MSDSVLNRYTSDSWSLELTGESSPLSRWTRRPVVKDERFRLSLLGFETGAAPISWLEGDRPLLEKLHDAVESYVQSGLQTPARTAQSMGRSTTQPTVPSSSTTLQPPKLAVLEPSAELESFAPLGGALQTASPFSLEADGNRLSHRLNYSPPQTQPRTLKLSTLQLADLLDVLDRWQGETLALPDAAAPAAREFVVPAWSRIAASTLIALGAAGGGISLLMSQPIAQTTAQADAEAAATANAGLNGAPNELSPFPQVSTNPSGELPNGQLANGQLANGANSQIFSAPFLKQRPGGLGNVDENSLPGLESGTVATLPSGVVTTNPGGLPGGDLGPGGLGSSGLASGRSSSVLSPDSMASISLPPGGSVAASSPLNFPTLPPPSSAVRLEPPKPAAKPAVTATSGAATPGAAIQQAKKPAAGTAIADARAELAKAEAEMAKNGTGDAARTAAPAAEAAAASAQQSSIASSSPAERAADSSNSSIASSSATTSSPAATAPRPAAPLPPRPVAVNTPFRQPTGAAQSSAMKTYFESKWKPPADLKQPLQYQLILSGEGSIDKMNPLSPAATQYAETAGIPSLGEAFVPGSTEIQDATFVLTLGVDGSVDVSVENVTPRR